MRERVGNYGYVTERYMMRVVQERFSLGVDT